jgi:hypothetical protein
MARKPSAWNKHVKATFTELRKGNPSASFKEALKVAAGTYKKGFTSGQHPKKGQKSRTRKGELDFTTKKPDKDFHQKGHDIKKKRKPFTTGGKKTKARKGRKGRKTRKNRKTRRC